MPAYICRTCGVQAPPSEQAPLRCPICEDERQYIGWSGQQWTTLPEMAAEGRRNELHEEEPHLVGIATNPSFAIRQRALLVRTPAGNVLWDCVSYLDAETVAAVKALGGISAISCSHPHFYGNMFDWAEAFDCPVLVPAEDAAWVQRRTSALELWEGSSREVLPGVTLLKLGGHFDGSAVLNWTAGAEGHGALLSGDTLTVGMDRRCVSFMYSYPNDIPLGVSAIDRIVTGLAPFRYERIYSGWKDRTVARDAREAVERSAERYLRMIRS